MSILIGQFFMYHLISYKPHEKRGALFEITLRPILDQFIDIMSEPIMSGTTYI